MFDPTGVSATLTSVNAILDLLRNAKDAQLANAISREVASLQGKLIDVQQQILAIQEEKAKLRAENEKFKTSVFHHSVIWRTRPDGTEDGPFCPVCIAEGTDMRLMLRPHVSQQGPSLYLYCPRTHLEQSAARDLGRGREAVYLIPRDLLPADRYYVSE